MSAWCDKIDSKNFYISLFLPFIVFVPVLLHWRTVNYNTLVVIYSTTQQLLPQLKPSACNQILTVILPHLYLGTKTSRIASYFTFFSCANMSINKCRKTRTALELALNEWILEVFQVTSFHTIFNY